MKDFQNFISLNTQEFIEMKEAGITIIDVRRDDEWFIYGVIEGSVKITFFDEVGEYDIDQFMDAFTKEVTSKEQAFVLVCAHANRTKTIGNFLGGQMGYTNVYELDGGIIHGWIDEGYPTVKERRRKRDT